MYQRILVPHDGSPVSTRGLDEAIRMAQTMHAQIRLLHVVDEWIYGSGFETCGVYSDEVIASLCDAGNAILVAGKARVEAAGLPADVRLVETCGGRVCDVVSREAQAWPAELIVIGTHGRRGVGRLMMGSDAEQIVRTSNVPVLLVRALPPLRVGESASAVVAAMPAVA